MSKYSPEFDGFRQLCGDAITTLNSLANRTPIICYTQEQVDYIVANCKYELTIEHVDYYFVLQRKELLKRKVYKNGKERK